MPKSTVPTDFIQVSIIIPVMNEDENITPLAAEITETMQTTEWSWECLWIDDFSTDNTRDELRRLHCRDCRHLYTFHDRNYGQSAALATGFRETRGDILVTLDGDGQNAPQSIPMLIQTLVSENADMVNGWREKRQDNLVRKISSRLANGFRNWLTREQVRDVGCALRAFRRECIDHVPVFKGMHRFFPTLVRLGGHTRILERPVSHRPRERGKTKYGINNRLWVGIADTIAVCWMRHRLIVPHTENVRFSLMAASDKISPEVSAKPVPEAL